MKFLKIDNRYVLAFVQGLLITFLIGYVVSENIRAKMISTHIDGNIIIGVITAFGLIATIKQSRKDRQFTYGLSMSGRFEESLIETVTLLITIMHSSTVLAKTVEDIAEAEKNNARYLDDGNVAKAISAIEISGPKVAAFINLYYQTEANAWNIVMSKMSDLSTTAKNILVNYENSLLLGSGKNNAYLKNIESYVSSTKKNAKEVESDTLAIRENIVAIVNERKEHLLTK